MITKDDEPEKGRGPKSGTEKLALKRGWPGCGAQSKNRTPPLEKEYLEGKGKKIPKEELRALGGNIKSEESKNLIREHAPLPKRVGQGL